jgi:chromate transporter
MNSRQKLLQIFLTFSKIGLFTLGGGYAMLPLIQREVVSKHHWLDEETFIDGVAASQACPGPIAVNISVYAGYQIAGTTGAALAVLGTVLPSFVILLLIAMSFSDWSELPMIQKAFNGLRPCVTALIAVPVYNMLKSTRAKWYAYLLPVIGLVSISGFGISPIAFILLSILLSWWKVLYQKTRTTGQKIAEK